MYKRMQMRALEITPPSSSSSRPPSIRKDAVIDSRLIKPFLLSLSISRFRLPLLLLLLPPPSFLRRFLGAGLVSKPRGWGTVDGFAMQKKVIGFSRGGEGKKKEKRRERGSNLSRREAEGGCSLCSIHLCIGVGCMLVSNSEDVPCTKWPPWARMPGIAASRPRLADPWGIEDTC